MDKNLDPEACYRALQARDPRFDGVFYVGVLSTGIYCRPICSAGPPKFENCIFLPSAAAAQQLGFRPCLRCRPELSPGIAGWRGTATTVSRALYLISDGALNDGGVDELADRLGVTARHLRRLFQRHLGATPISVAQTHRILFAKKLLGESSLTVTEIAMAAGFGSIRRFNSVMQRVFGMPPSRLRRLAEPEPNGTTGISLKLPFSPPYDWQAMIDFLALRAIPGVETVESGRYLRTFAIEGACGSVAVKLGGDNYLLATIWTSNVAALGGIIGRLRRLFDLDADMTAIDTHLMADPALAVRVLSRPGVRVPGAWDEFELAVRAVLGQQISVRAATTLAGRLADLAGGSLEPRMRAPEIDLHRLFPTPAELARADLTRTGIVASRAQTLHNLAHAMLDDPRLLRPFESLDATVEKLVSVPGLGPWTAQYIAMRALREPDAFPASDLGLLRALEDFNGRPTPAQVSSRAEGWRPWRAYGAMRLWAQPSVDHR
ncbi:DNA-3-methyladenine glycosylase 2 [mine drainage metagenome]|uniref:DNA-3-methyladenine glycosylase 2 n=1 Tax=mine drainage metagenome TaxID=410659 RepID=A0A1J5T0N3_9ZZZZ